MSGGHALADARSALSAGRWHEARAAYERCLVDGETAEVHFGLARALWWLGEPRAAVERCIRAYALFRRAGETADAARCAVWLAITFKADFGNVSAASGWLARADRLLEGLASGPLHGWTLVARAYRMADLDAAANLTARAVDIARSADDVDLELVALSQLGLIRVGRGETAAGFVLIDEAMAAALAREGSTLDTLVYTCCDMLNACEVVADVERAAQWCTLATDVVSTYGCPFLYAECRICYGSVLAATGRWADAERELTAGLRIAAGSSPGLHARALLRLAGLRIRQGRLAEAEHLLTSADGAMLHEAEESLWLAALLLARGDGGAAGRALERRLPDLHAHRWHLAAALELLVDAHLSAGHRELEQADAAAGQLSGVAAAAGADRLLAMAAGARGRVAAARGDLTAATESFEAARTLWAALGLPYELARSRFDLARVLAGSQPEEAVDHARRALRALDQLGAALDADRVAAFLRSLGVHPRAGVRSTGPLTAREQDVLRLLGQGMSNPEIAQRLFITRKTAAHHVSSVLAKLGLRNRAEAAAYAASVLGPPTLPGAATPPPAPDGR